MMELTNRNWISGFVCGQLGIRLEHPNRPYQYKVNPADFIRKIFDLPWETSGSRVNEESAEAIVPERGRAES